MTSEVNRDQCVLAGRRLWLYNADLHKLAHHVRRWPAKVFFCGNDAVFERLHERLL